MEEIGPNVSQLAMPDAPGGTFAVSVDDKGRLKLPADLVEYLDGFKEPRKVFITTFDGIEIRVYPMPPWRETQAKLQAPGSDAKVRKAMALLAAENGQTVMVDAQGRLTLPAELRKAMSLEGGELRMYCFQHRIMAVRSEEHARRVAAAKVFLAEGTSYMEENGL